MQHLRTLLPKTIQGAFRSRSSNIGYLDPLGNKHDGMAPVNLDLLHLLLSHSNLPFQEIRTQVPSVAGLLRWHFTRGAHTPTPKYLPRGSNVVPFWL